MSVETYTNLATYAAIEQAMAEVVKQEFDEKPFFTTLLSGTWTPQQLRHFAIQYSYYSRHFPRVLGAAISAMHPLDSWWVPLADNLWDEAGRGQLGKSHEQLYKTFLNSVDPNLLFDKNGIPCDPMSPAVDKAIRTFIQFFYTASPLEAMAAVGLGSELFAGAVMGMIGRGLEHPNYQTTGKLDTLFWTVHADEHEPHHYQLCKDILEKFTHPDELQTMFRVGERIAKSEALMYDELFQEMMQIDQ